MIEEIKIVLLRTTKKISNPRNAFRKSRRNKHQNHDEY
jgi:hypothetical protein